MSDTTDVDDELEALRAFGEPDEEDSLRVKPSSGLVTPLPASVPPHKALAASPAPYTFPDVLAEALVLATRPQDALHSRLDELCHGHKHGSRAPYAAIRSEVCAISMAMNMGGLRSPRFRHMRRVAKVPTSGTHPEEQHVLSNDRKMIDLHWLHLHGDRREIDDSDFRRLLSTDEFDFTLASEFCSRGWKTEARVEKIMVLTEFEQWQLAALAGQAVQKRAEQIQLQSKAVEKRIREIAFVRRQLRDQAPALSALWRAEQMCMGMPHSDKLIGRFFAWQMGTTPLAKSTLSQKLKLLREVLTGSPLAPVTP